MKEILITSSVLIVVLLLLRVIFAKKVSRVLIYGAWGLVALRLLVPVQIGEIDFSILTSAKPMTEAITEVSNKQVAGVTEQDAYREIIKDYVEKDQTVFTPEVQEHIQSALRDEMPKEEIAVMIDKVYAEQEVFVPEVQQQVQQQVEETAEPITLGQIATIVWLAGVAVMAAWFMIVNLRHSRMLRKNREKLDCESPIPVYVSEKVGSPCLVGLFRPAVYLTPESAEDPTVLRHVLTHELTHYAHKDHIWSVVRCVCLCAYWFDPLVWVAAWFSRRDCELACDEGALKRLGEGERIAYGKSLLDVVSHASTPANLMQTATSMNETKKQLRERVNFIVKKQKISIIAAVCMVIVCAIVAGCAAAGPASSQKPGVGSNPSVPSSSETTPSSSTTRPTDPDNPNPMKWIQLLTKVENRGEVTTALSYDEQWNLKEVDGVTKRRIEIDAANRTMKVYLPEGGDFLAEAYTYDAAGNLIMMQSFGNPAFTEEYFYDASGKLQKQICTYAEGGSIFSGMKIETVYNYDEAGRKESQYEYQYIEDFPGEVVRYEGTKIFYQYDALGNLIREDWYTGKGDKMQYVIYTFDAEHRSEKREVFEEKETWEGKFDVLKEMSIYYYNAEGKVICIEECNPESQRVEFTYTYVYQTVQVPVDFFAPLYVNPTERKVVFQGDDSTPTNLTKWVYLLTRIDTDREMTTATRNAVLSYDDEWNLTEYVIHHYESEMWRNSVETNTEERTIKVYSQYSALLEEYTYDAEGKLIKVGDGTGKARKETEYSYDAADRLLKTTTLEWSGLSDTASSIQEKILSYDANGRLQTKSYYEAILVNGEEAPNSRIRTLHYVYQYNEQGDLSRVDQYNWADVITYYMTYTYDTSTRTVTENRYNDDDRLLETTITQYDTAGNPVRMIVDDGEYVTTTTYAYQMVEVPWDFFAPQMDELPYMEMFVIPRPIAPSEPDHNN